jgi:hypothetical protein
MGDAVVLSGSEEGTAGAAAFAWDVVKGEVIAAVPVGEKVKAVSCVAWNEGAGDWTLSKTSGKDPTSSVDSDSTLGQQSAEFKPKTSKCNFPRVDVRYPRFLNYHGPHYAAAAEARLAGSCTVWKRPNFIRRL